MATGVIDPPSAKPNNAKEKQIGEKDVYSGLTETSVEKFGFGILTPNWAYEEETVDGVSNPVLDKDTIRVMTPVLATVIKAGDELGDAEKYMHAYLDYVKGNLAKTDVLPEQGDMAQTEYNEMLNIRHTKMALKHTSVILERIVKATLAENEEGAIMSTDSVIGLLDFAREGGINLDDFAAELPIEALVDGMERPNRIIDTQAVRMLSAQSIDEAFAEGRIDETARDLAKADLKQTANKLIDKLRVA